MGAAQSSQEQQTTTSPGAIRFYRSMSSQEFLTPSQVQQVNELTPAQKKELVAAIKEQQTEASKEIKEIVKQAAHKAREQKKSQASVPTQQVAQELSQQENKKLANLPDYIHSQAQAKISKVIARRNAKAKKIVDAELKKHKVEKTGCKAWASNKRKDPENPKNPASGRNVAKDKKTYNLINKVCSKKKAACAQPDKSPFKGGRTLKPESRQHKIITKICK